MKPLSYRAIIVAAVCGAAKYLQFYEIYSMVFISYC